MAEKRSRRAVLTALGGLSGTALAGCTALTGGSTTDESATPPGKGDETGTPSETASPSDPANGPVATASVPTAETDYPVMGAADAPVRATLYGAWKCPYTRLFARQMLPQIVTEHVQPGELRLRFRAVRYQMDSSDNDEPRANEAGLAVWNEAPERFWSYFAHLFETQPPETRAWATVDRLVALASEAGVERTEPIRTAISSQTYASLWKESIRVARQREMDGTPRLALDGEVTAPTVHPSATIEQLHAAVESND